MDKFNHRRMAGLLIIIMTLSLLCFWELWGRKNIGYDKIPVLNQSVEANGLILESMITYRAVETPAGKVLRSGSERRIIGKLAGQYIPEGEPLYPEYFSENLFQVGEANGKYVLSVPDHWLTSYPQTVRRGDKVFFYCKGSLVTEAVVAYVKDSNNQEIVSQDKERLNANGTVGLLEVVVTAEQAEKLGKLAAKGNQFDILYY